MAYLNPANILSVLTYTEYKSDQTCRALHLGNCDKTISYLTCSISSRAPALRNLLPLPLITQCTATCLAVSIRQSFSTISYS